MATTSTKFIPNGDLDFSEMALRFARGLASDPRKFKASEEDAVAVTSAVDRFREALRKARPGGRRSGSRAETLAKDAARKEAERIIRRLAGAIRSNPDIDAATKALIGINVPKRPRRAAHGAVGGNGGLLPGAGAGVRESPELRFVRAIHRSVHVPEHELVFRGRAGKKKPAGAARLELFVELVSPDARLPEFPGGSGASGGGLHYLRSYGRSPIVLVPPLADRAMRVVYWGRWADAAGNVGPFSAAAAGWVEGGSHHLMGPRVSGGGVDSPVERTVAASTSLAERMLPGAGAGEGADELPGAAAEERMRVMVAVMQTQQRFLESAGGEPKRLDAA